MQFVLICRDRPGALSDRLAVRDRHMAGIRAGKLNGSIIDGGALLGPESEMNGSIILCEFPDRAALDAYLAEEVYAAEGVWGDVEILPMRRVDWAKLLN